MDFRRVANGRGSAHASPLLLFHRPRTMRMVGIGRLVADADRPVGGARRNHVDDRFQRVGVERHRAGDPPSDELQPHDAERHEDGVEGQPLDLLLGRHSHPPSEAEPMKARNVTPPSPSLSPCAAGVAPARTVD